LSDKSYGARIGREARLWLDILDVGNNLRWLSREEDRVRELRKGAPLVGREVIGSSRGEKRKVVPGEATGNKTWRRIENERHAVFALSGGALERG
jgi:hypothetical protein